MLDFDSSDKETNELEFFPFEKLRPEQERMILDIANAIKKKRNILINAPTGIGKTIAALTPCLKLISKNPEMKILFLTSRHTQHQIVVETIMKINKILKKDFKVASVFGKKNLCSFEAVNFTNSEFLDYCKKLRESKKCFFYSNVYEAKNNKIFSETASSAMNYLAKNFEQVESLKDFCKARNLCTYEISCALARKANVIVLDYNYVFNDSIREGFFKKINASLKNSVLIIDEAHNLHERLKEILSQRISSKTIRLAKKEAERFNFDFQNELNVLEEFFSKEASLIKEKNFNERLIPNNKLIECVESFDKDSSFEEFANLFYLYGERVRELENRSFIGRIADFLFLLKQTHKSEAFITVLKKMDDVLFLNYTCLDPSVLSEKILNDAFFVIAMSATLNPPEMFRKILGFKNTEIKSYKNPFPKKNRLTLVIPKTTTKYDFRNEQEFIKNAMIISSIMEIVPGRMLVFFPSYYIMKRISSFIKFPAKKLFFENQRMSKEEKKRLIEEFLSYKNSALFGVIRASFSEGIDLPNKLKAVVVVGIPLEPPSSEVKKVISYYDKKFGNGLQYGYIIPTINKTIQAAGRCIRTEKDKGALIFIDRRYLSKFYNSFFPKDWEIKVGFDFENELKKFFREEN
ncbi:MAG: ATP-dependent DNA helicase [Candidatus Woesearchaeota archaeon]